MRSLGLLVDGPVVWGRAVRSSAPGVFVVELPAGAEKAPMDHGQLRRWLERVPELRLDGRPPTPHQIGRRLASFWLPWEPILYVGRSARALGPRLAALHATPLGDARPYSGGHWLKTLSIVSDLRVWWAETDAHEEYEDALLGEVAARVPAEVAATLPDPSLVLPFANLRRTGGATKPHGLENALREGSAGSRQPPAAGPVPGSDLARRRPRAAGSSVARRRSPASVSTRPAGDPNYVSQAGLDRLVAELDELRKHARPQVIARVKAARELGDLRENADYEAARNEQSFLEGRIQALERLIKTTELVQTPDVSGAVALGSTVVVETGGETETYVVVGSTEADPAAGRISHASPVGRALLGTRAGEEVTAELPSGPVRFRIREVR